MHGLIAIVPDAGPVGQAPALSLPRVARPTPIRLPSLHESLLGSRASSVASAKRLQRKEGGVRGCRAGLEVNISGFIRIRPSPSAASTMGRDRPPVVVIHQGGDHGCLITILLLIVAWPLAIAYWILRLVAWVVATTVDWLTLGPVRRRRH